MDLQNSEDFWRKDHVINSNIFRGFGWNVVGDCVRTSLEMGRSQLTVSKILHYFFFYLGINNDRTR